VGERGVPGDGTQETEEEVMPDIQERIKKHQALCAERNFPNFAPNNGKCFSCKKQVFEREDGTRFITGCPHCGRTFCD
jgi:hypothetical protein